MEPQFSEIQALMDLGLTKVQARVYLALLKSGPSKTSAISKTSKVAQPDTYKTLSKLQQLGLVEKIIKKPLEYRATPVNEGISLLLETKTRQYEKMRSEAKILLSTAKTEKSDIEKQVEPPQFVLIPRRTVIKRIDTAIEEAQLGIDLVLSWKRFSCGITNTFAESMESAWAKNVKIRFIIESPLKTKTAKQLIQFCRAKPFCQIKFIRYCPTIVFGIYDKKEVFIIVDPKTDLPGSPALWSNNSSLIALAQDHFEILWFTAIESNFETPRKPKKQRSNFPQIN